MNTTRILVFALLSPGFVYVSLAEDGAAGPRAAVERNGTATEKSAGAYDLTITPVARKSAAVAADTVISEVYENVVVAAGKSVSLNSALDYSSAPTVAVTVLCIICNSSATALANSGLVLQARWTVPDAESYATAESKSATAFTYSDSGGAVFNVYGPQFRLGLQNKGTQTIALQQVTIFRRSQ